MTLMGVMGLPWHVAGTVLCINHINSLKKESETAAPGERPVFLGVRYGSASSHSRTSRTRYGT